MCAVCPGQRATTVWPLCITSSHHLVFHLRLEVLTVVLYHTGAVAGQSSDKKVLQPGQVSLPVPEQLSPATAADHDHSATETASIILLPIKHQPATVASNVKAAPTALPPVKDRAAVQSAAFGPAEEAGHVKKSARIQSAQSASPLPVNVSELKQVMVKNKQAAPAPVKVDVTASADAATSGHAAREEHMSSSPAGASSSSAVRSPAAHSGASTAEPVSLAPTAAFKGPFAHAAHFSQPSNTPVLPIKASPGPSKASAVRPGAPVPINSSSPPSQTSAPGSSPSSAPSVPSPSSRLQSASSLAAPMTSPSAFRPSSSVPLTAAPAQPARPASTATQSSSADHKATPSEAGNGALATAVVDGHTAVGTASHAQQPPSQSNELHPSTPDALPTPLHLADTSSQTPQLTWKQADQDRGNTAAKSVKIVRCVLLLTHASCHTLDAQFTPPACRARPF